MVESPLLAAIPQAALGAARLASKTHKHTKKEALCARLLQKDWNQVCDLEAI